MNPITAAECSRNSILRYLKDELEPMEQTAFLEHLDKCAECRRQIEEAAGDVHDWHTITSALQDLDSPTTTGTKTAHQEKGSSANYTAQSLELAWISAWLGQASSANAIGKIGMFDALRVIGVGSSGVIFLAREPSLGREVAIKVLSPHLAKSSVSRQRFEREARATAGLVHENIIPIYQVSEWRGLPYLVMQYFPESSLQEYLRTQGKLEVESALRLALEIAKGLEKSHSFGIIHRDIKPANILLSNGAERAVLTDFGLAQSKDDLHLTCSGLLAGTPHFMSPEQARGEEIDFRSDIYSLGSVLFAMIAGKPPLHSESESNAIRRLASGRLPSLREADPNVSDAVVEFVDCLISPNAEDRPCSTTAVVSWLSQSVAHSREPHLQPQPASIQNQFQSSGKRPSHRALGRFIFLTITLAIIGLTLSLTYKFYWRNDLGPEDARKYAEYHSRNRWLSFRCASNDTAYELVDVRVSLLKDAVETDSNYERQLNVMVPGVGPAPQDVFYYVLPVDNKFSVTSIWRQKDNHLIDAPIVEQRDTLSWNHSRHDQVGLVPPDQREKE